MSDSTSPILVEDTSNKFLDNLNSSEISKYIAIAILIVLCLNIFVLDVSTLAKSQPAPLPKNQQNNIISNETLACSKSCVDLFNSTIASQSSLALTTTPTQAFTPTSTPTYTPTPTPNPTLKEVFIPLGLGFGNSPDWTTIPGVGASIDPSNYGEIASVFFEVTVRIPTGNQTVYVRLYNADNYQSIANSDVSLSGGTPTILVSKPISLQGGKNLYQVQMKTQLQYLTYIDQARIRIIMK